MRDRVRPPKELEHVLDRLKDDGVFETKQKGMMFAASLGYALRDRRKDLPDMQGGGEGIRLEYFDNAYDTGFINALAVADTDDLKILSDTRQPERIDKFERYAAIGLARLEEVCYQERRGSLDGVLWILDSLRNPPEERLPGIEAEVRKIEKLL